MKKAEHHQTIYTNSSGTDCLYTTDGGLYVRDVVINAGIDEQVLIGHLSDIHFNYCNKRDMDEADPVIMSTYEHRRWLADGYSVQAARRCFDFLDDADQIVLNGDTLDYLSYGCMELMEREVWEKHPDVIATLGGHEYARQMQGVVPEYKSLEERIAILEKFWKHDILYVSKLIKKKVLVIGMNDDMARFNPVQKQKLAADLSLARKNGYTVLIFVHEPMVTGNPKYKHFTVDDIIFKGDTSGFPKDLCSGAETGHKITGGELCDEITKEVYNLIVSSADVVKGIFAGHYHNHMYLDVIGKTPSGDTVLIPQYINTATACDNGHLMRILIK